MHEFTLDTRLGRVAGLRAAHVATTAPRVLALHGWLDNAASFIPLHAHLPGIDLVALDMPGHGASDHLPEAAEYTVVNTARAIFAAADALGWEQFSLLGHSLGGAVASLMAAAAPQRIERLGTIESLGALSAEQGRHVASLREAFARPRGPRKPLRVFADPAAALRARMQVGGIAPDAARLLVDRSLVPVRGDDVPRGFSWRSDPRLTRPTAIRISEEQVREQLRAIECPAWVIYAEPAQVYFPEEQRRERFECLRDGQLVVLRGGHHLHMEAPAEVAAALAGFLARG
ncbi:MAG: alpha/beta fold hydrolase [Lysobacter sp.]